MLHQINFVRESTGRASAGRRPLRPSAELCSTLLFGRSFDSSGISLVTFAFARLPPVAMHKIFFDPFDTFYLREYRSKNKKGEGNIPFTLL